MMKHNSTPYTKMHGTGNLILIVDQRGDNLPPPDQETLRVLGNEATGPGFDQLMWLIPADDRLSIAAYRVFNADGSEVEQCGNGVRCVAKYLAGFDGNGQKIALQGPTGPVAAIVHSNGQVSVSMGTPVLEPREIPFDADNRADSYELDLGHEKIEISAVSMGNPHAVLQVADIASAPVDTLGPQIERHARFPELTNVGFMHIDDRCNIDLRVFERGVGETAACGTGACAAVVAGRRLGLLGEEVCVKLPGGQVMVSWRGDQAAVWLRGNAELISEGTVDL